MEFQVKSVCGMARAGVLHTPHGSILTPAFLPVATQASVKGVTPDEVRAVGASAIIANTYHLYLRPGVEVVKSLGGLHLFMGWDGPIITDSGGFQAFSLGTLCRIMDHGILFRSHIDGSEHLFTPERAIEYQEALGADIIMALDVCTTYDATRQEVECAMERTHRWATLCKESHRRGDQALFGIVQGGLHEDLREMAAEYVCSLNFPGYAIGGLGVGEPKEELYRFTNYIARLLPHEKPRHLMGVGSPEDLVECVTRGIDLFDCALPTRVARNGSLFTREGRVNITSSRFRKQDSAIDPGCNCMACQNYSVAYMHHLFRANELLGLRLATIHNLRFVSLLMEELREAIARGTLAQFASHFLANYRPADEEARRSQAVKWRQP